MWKPKQRIKHEVKSGSWPNSDDVKRSLLFAPYRNGRLQLSQRTWVPAMVPWRATENGEVTQNVVDWYRRFAQGRPGAIVVEATGIRDVPSGPLLRIGHDRYVPGLKQIVEAVKEASHGETKLFIQIIDFLSIKRRPDRNKFLQRFLNVDESLRNNMSSVIDSADLSDDKIREHLCTLEDEELEALLDSRQFESMNRGHRERVTDTHLPHIQELPDTLPTLFSDAAARAQAAGFDGVELHYAHAYTMASFLSRLNTRDDGYGGSLENRARLPLKVFKAVREKVSTEFLVGCRMLSDDCIDGGSDVADASYFANEFANAGMDFISLSRGGKFEDAKLPRVGEAIYPYTGQSGYECMPAYISDEFGPFGRNITPSAAIRESVRKAGFDTPIVVAGGIHSFEQAEDLLTKDQADVVALARQSLADPDWFVKVKSGLGKQVVSCTYTNYCEGLDSKHKMVTCRLWDRTDLDDADVTLTPDGKRRTIAPDWSPDSTDSDT